MLRLIKQLSGRVSSSMYASVSNQQDAARIAFLRQLEREIKEKEGRGTWGQVPCPYLIKNNGTWYLSPCPASTILHWTRQLMTLVFFPVLTGIILRS